MVKIFFIYADNCEHCQEALRIIEEAIKKCKDITCEITKFRYDTPVAVNIAINNGIDDLPGFIVGTKAFNGGNYSLKEVVDAIREEEKSN
jgi:deferrochelatase/peroxidase EfeB